jgi:hypothetical protein
MHDHVTPHTVIAEPDAASYIGYSLAALRLWRRQGRGPVYIRHGRSIRYRVEDLDRWVSAHLVQPLQS